MNKLKSEKIVLEMFQKRFFFRRYYVNWIAGINTYKVEYLCIYSFCDWFLFPLPNRSTPWVLLHFHWIVLKPAIQQNKNYTFNSTHDLLECKLIWNALAAFWELCHLLDVAERDTPNSPDCFLVATRYRI